MTAASSSGEAKRRSKSTAPTWRFIPRAARSVPGTLTPDPEILVRSERDGTIDNVNNFLDCVRSRKTPNANIHIAFEAARTSWIGNIALKRGKKVTWDTSQGKAV